MEREELSPEPAEEKNKIELTSLTRLERATCMPNADREVILENFMS